MTFPPPPAPPPPPPPTPPPAWPPVPPGLPGSAQAPGATPTARRSSSLVPLLVVGTIGLIALIAGGAVAAMLIVMSRNATAPVDAVADAPPAAEAPAPTAPPDVAPPEAPPPASEPVAAEPAPPVARPERAADDPAPADDEPPARPTPAERRATAERARRAAAEDEPVERAIRVDGAIQPPRKTRDVRPVYPQIAQSARVQGVVKIEATIDRDGRVAEARMLRSIPLLDQAALDAVRQWEYEPTLLNGVAVPVILTVTVNFTLH
jgi:TonB family protein